MFFYGPIIEGAKVRQKRESGSFTFSHSLTHSLTISFSLTLFLSLSLYFFLSHSFSFSLTLFLSLSHTHMQVHNEYTYTLSLSLFLTHIHSLFLFLSFSLSHTQTYASAQWDTYSYTLSFFLSHTLISLKRSFLSHWLTLLRLLLSLLPSSLSLSLSLSLSKSPQFFTSTWANCPQQFPLSLFASLSPFPECILKRTKKPIFCSTGLRYLSMSELLLINGERIFTYQMMRGLLKRQFKHTLVGLYRCFYCYGCTCFQISLEIYLCCYWY